MKISKIYDKRRSRVRRPRRCKDDVTSTSPSSLCSICARTIDLGQTFLCDTTFNHHATFDDIIASSNKGCLMCSAVLDVHQNSSQYGLFQHHLEKYLGDENSHITCRFQARTGEQSATNLSWRIGDSDYIGMLSTFTEVGR